jgi:hypothetical protein
MTSCLRTSVSNKRYWLRVGEAPGGPQDAAGCRDVVWRLTSFSWRPCGSSWQSSSPPTLLSSFSSPFSLSWPCCSPCMRWLDQSARAAYRRLHHSAYMTIAKIAKSPRNDVYCARRDRASCVEAARRTRDVASRSGPIDMSISSDRAGEVRWRSRNSTGVARAAHESQSAVPRRNPA